MMLHLESIYHVSIISTTYLSVKKKSIFNLKHEHDMNQAAITVVLILPSHSSNKDAAANTFPFSRRNSSVVEVIVKFLSVTIIQYITSNVG